MPGGRHRAKGWRKPAAILGVLAVIGTTAGLWIAAMGVTGAAIAIISK